MAIIDLDRSKDIKFLFEKSNNCTNRFQGRDGIISQEIRFKERYVGVKCLSLLNSLVFPL